MTLRGWSHDTLFTPVIATFVDVRNTTEEVRQKRFWERWLTSRINNIKESIGKWVECDYLISCISLSALVPAFFSSQSCPLALFCCNLVCYVQWNLWSMYTVIRTLKCFSFFDNIVYLRQFVWLTWPVNA